MCQVDLQPQKACRQDNDLYYLVEDMIVVVQMY